MATSKEDTERVRGTPCFQPVSSRVSFPALEEEVLRFWREHDIFHKVDEVRQDAPWFVLYEGPPTANGAPGTHHVLARIFKDVIPRYKTMKGFRPLRKGGWDTHGLPVELEVERELGIISKPQIEEYGIERFNALCKESVMRYVRDWEELTDRIGFWIDMPNAYVTFTNDYIETGWWIIKQLWDRGLVYQDMKGTPHCPRCETSLSSHEVALGYQENTPDPSVFVKFPVSQQQPEDVPSAQEVARRLAAGLPDGPVSFLAWTTTPWTLPGNTALAVTPDAPYALVERTRAGSQAERLVLASALVDRVMGDGDRVVDTLRGAELAGLTYELPYDPASYSVPITRFGRQLREGVGEIPTLAPAERVMPRVFASQMVSLEDGTGIVHIAPAFGDEDFSAGREHGLAFVQPVDIQGRITGAYPFAGKFVKKADEEIMADLQARGLLYRREVYHHTYPFCWRCSSPLLFYAKSSWYIKTTAFKERLVSGNREIHWYPEHIQEGRFGEWLRNNVDWAISRERYWGTPLPIWRCDGCNTHDCLGSVAEVRERALAEDRPLLEAEGLDLHRPFVDGIRVACLQCGNAMQRVPEVLDCWFDSGAMPFAQWHVPVDATVTSLQQTGFLPADYICEAVDQTRGWFYSLHALATLLTDQVCYRNVICLGLILDEHGEKMSKSRGNVVAPWPVIQAHGADALRWYLFTAAPPGSDRRFSERLVGESVRQFFLTLWNTYAFFVTYANIDGFSPNQAAQVEPTSDLDRWALSALNGLVREVTRLLDDYNPTDAGRRIAAFVDDLSNWYVRRSRNRFWRSRAAADNDDQDKLSAYATLYTCLETLARLLAPFTPFLAETLYRNLALSVDDSAPQSVHLADFPEANETLIDNELVQGMRLVMRFASLGRAARSKAGIRVRQPLSRILVHPRSADEGEVVERLQRHLLDELNIKELAVLDGEEEVARFFRVRPNLAAIGPRLGAQTSQVVVAFNQADPISLLVAARSGRSIEVGGVTLQPEELEITPADVEGYAVASEGGYTVAVATVVTPELADEGLARELVHAIQTMRRDAGFDISDRIVAWYQGNDTLRRVMEQHAPYIRQETLAWELRPSPADSEAHVQEHRLVGWPVTLGVRRVAE